MLSVQPPAPPEPPDRPSHGSPTTSPSDHDLLKPILAHRDIACGRCGYNLRGITAAACPECAAPLLLPAALGSTRGYGPGSIIVWASSLAITVCFIYSEWYYNSGIPFIHWDPDPAATIIFTVLPIIITGVVIAILGQAGHPAPRARRRYWLYTRIATAVLCIALVISVLVAVG